MKAIYINLDPYLQEIVDWRKNNPLDEETGHYPTPPPSFSPLPVAVTIPLGQSAGIYKEVTVDDSNWYYDIVTIDNVEIGINCISSADPETPGASGVVATDVVPGFSALVPSAKYAVLDVGGDTSLKVGIMLDGEDLMTFTIPVLVRREQASGPVDLVDFTPPAAAIAAGTDLKGTKFNGNEIVAAAGTGALSAPAGA